MTLRTSRPARLSGSNEFVYASSQRMMANKDFTEEDKKHIDEFHKAVNMSAKELEAWLKGEESKSVGQKTSETGESTGHESGRNIVQLQGKSKSSYTEADVHQMARVVSYVHRHMAQRPAGDISETRWRYSLMNWGHDPTKK